jgi:hypothetical protein
MLGQIEKLFRCRSWVPSGDLILGRFGVIWLTISLGLWAVSAAASEPSIEPPITAIKILGPDQAVVASQLGLRLIELHGMTERSKAEQFATFIYSIESLGDQILVSGGEPGEAGWAGLVNPALWAGRPQMLSGSSEFTDTIHAAAISADRAKVVFASLDGTAGVCGLQVGMPQVQFRGHSSGVTGAVWLDDSLVATSSRDATIRVWDSRNGDFIRTLSQHTDQVLLLKRSPAEGMRPMVASAGLDGTVRFWEPTIGRLVRFHRLDHERATCMAWALDGVTLVIGTTGGRLRWIDSRLASVTRTEQVSADWITAVDVAETGMVVFGTADGQLGKAGD